MIVRSLDKNNDWSFGKGLNDYKQLNDAIIQNITTRLRMILGDCFFASDEGIDWINLLGNKNQVALSLAISATILKTEGVTEINQLSLNIDSSRKLTISYEVKTIYTGLLGYGTVAISQALILTEGGDVLITEDGRRILGG